ncbi:MAG: acyl-CoA reductase [Candidatus Njordarchaeia archaeon]
MELKAYFLPNTLGNVEEKIEKKELEVDDYKILVPRVTAKEIGEILEKIKSSAREIYRKLELEEICEIIGELRQKWMDKRYEKRKIALDVLPKLTGLTKEQIIFYQFGTMEKMTPEAVEFLSNMEFDKGVLRKFKYLEKVGVWIRGHTSTLGFLKVKKMLKNMKKPELIAFITPSNVPGLIEVLGIFIGLVSKSAVLIKTPSKQPVFGPLFAESLREIDEKITETIAVIPWKGGSVEIEKEIFSHADAVSVIGSTESALSVKERLEKLYKNNGKFVKGCYHGGKFGLNIISKELANEKVAALSVIDGFGYEGYMCSSPAFGFFVEEGGELKPEAFAKAMHRYAEEISKHIPQSDLFKRYREKTLSKYLSLEAAEKVKVYTSENNNHAVVYSTEIDFTPDGQNRLLKVFPIKNINQVIPYLKRWREYLQTIGVAIPTSKIFNFAEKVAKLGVSNLRVVGTVTLPRVGEAWDGYYPILECSTREDLVHWVTINARDVEGEIENLYDKLYLRGLRNIS